MRKTCEETIKTCCETAKEADDSGLNIAIESFKKKHIRFLLRTKGFPEKVNKISQRRASQLTSSPNILHEETFSRCICFYNNLFTDCHSW